MYIHTFADSTQFFESSAQLVYVCLVPSQTLWEGYMKPNTHTHTISLSIYIIYISLSNTHTHHLSLYLIYQTHTHHLSLLSISNTHTPSIYISNTHTHTHTHHLSLLYIKHTHTISHTSLYLIHIKHTQHSETLAEIQEGTHCTAHLFHGLHILPAPGDEVLELGVARRTEVIFNLFQKLLNGLGVLQLVSHKYSHR